MIRKMNKYLLGSVAAAILPAAVASAAPLFNVQILGSASSSGPFTSSLQVTPDETVFIELVGQLSAVGATNVQGSTTRTISSETAGTDGNNSLSLNVLDAGGNSIQVSFNTDGALQNNYSLGSGATAGTRTSVGGGTNNELLGIRPIQSPGVFAGVTQVVIETASLVVSPTMVSGSSQITGAFGGTLSSLKINGGGGTNNVSVTTTSEGGADPFISYTPLTLSTVPEPASFAVLGMGGFGLLARRRRARA